MTEADDFEKRTRAVLEESAARLDGRTRSRLTQARHAALAHANRPARNRWRSYLPAGAATAAAVLAVVMWPGPQRGTSQLTQVASPVEDMELLTDGDAPDFVDDGVDLEFYEWAA